MNTTMRAIETTGTIDEQFRLTLDNPIPLTGKNKVRIIILYPETDDIDERDWLSAASKNPAFAFLNEPEEDIYTHADGKPFYDEG